MRRAIQCRHPARTVTLWLLRSIVCILRQPFWPLRGRPYARQPDAAQNLHQGTYFAEVFVAGKLEGWVPVTFSKS
jgi:hypothetical protein